MKRLLLSLCAAALACCLVACGETSLNNFTWFVDSIPANLDPQVAASSADVTACTNLYTGLVRKAADGSIVTAGCQTYTISPDGLQYTFTLAPDAVYLARRGVASEYRITADDYVFAFRRIYTAATRSPYTDTYAAIANSAAVLAGSAAPETLGVSAIDEHTVQFTLSQPDEAFLQKLTLPGAAPCDEEFFQSTGGTYGLTAASTLASGSFYLHNWTANGLFLRRTAEGDAINNLRLVQNTEHADLTAAELVAEEYCSAALDQSGTAAGQNGIDYTDTTWCLVFNQRSKPLANADVRAALAAAAYKVPLGLENTAGFLPTEGLVPAGTQANGTDYTALRGNILPQLGEAKALYQQTMAQPDAPRVTGLTLLVPEGSEIAAISQAINAAWQKEFSLFFSIETVSQTELQQRLTTGSYTIALAPLQLTQNDPLALLARFERGGFTGWADAEYTALCRAAAQTSGSERARLCAAAEQQLLQQCVAVPLFCQQRRLVLHSGVQNLLFDPYGPVLDLTWATRSQNN
ncbi:MAG: peptide ABC transporter substrate-binding protein [Faecalibacterium sp.]|nr:peptide ABC transporter substrate-binding protein [Faecalibacterium sp.]